MTNEIIIKKWRTGLNTLQIAKEYMKKHNEEAKKKKIARINLNQALAYIEPIIYEFETKDWRKTK